MDRANPDMAANSFRAAD